MNVYTIGLMISLAVYFAVGSYAGRKVKHLEDYFVAGRQAPTLLIVGTLVASLMSTNAFMGETGQGYAGYPTIILILTAINCIGYTAGALFFGRFLRRSRALTVAEYFGQRFVSRRVQSVAGASIVFGCTGYLMVVTQGTATIVHEVTGLSFHLALFLTWSGYTLFTMYSGSRGVVLTDTMMFLLFTAVALLGLAFIVEEAGGWFATIQDLATFESKPGIVSWHGMVGEGADWASATDAMIYAVILGIAWGVVVAVSPWQASRYLMARDEHTVIRSAMITAATVLVLYSVLMLSGAAINLLNPMIQPAQENMIWAAMNVMPTLIGVLLMSGIMAAGLSSASTFLSLVGFSVTNDLVPSAHADDSRQLRMSRWAMIGVSLAALVIANFIPQGNLFWITYFVGTLYASAWGPVAFMSVWSRRITEGAAFWGIIAGLLGNLVARVLSMLGIVEFPVYFHPIVVGALLSYITVEVAILRGTVTQQEHEIRERLHETPEAEIDPARQRGTLRCAKAIIWCGVVFAGVLIVFYALPYQRATGGSAGGEFVMALGIGLSLVVAGALAWWGTARSYTR
ncbi:MAG: sodium:solute symporter family protein [Halieaceae bacterium]|jgi:Na+/proline symporter|nr:sodium:solute symporter family protein [Halieaceae bacterium]